MSMLLLNHAQEKAKEVRKEHELKVPADLLKITKKENISVAVTDLSHLEKQAGRKISGCISVHNGKKEIFINEDESMARRNFTLAHELGHYFLHIPKDTEQAIISYRGLRSPQETEANQFAAELLMPYEEVLKAHNKMLYPVVSLLATQFGVSSEAMRYKLDEMGLNSIG